MFRPAKGRVEITLPDYTRANKLIWSFVRCKLWYPGRTRPNLHVSRIHVEAIVRGLLQEYGEITFVTEHFAREICSASCYRAETSHWLCTCGGCVARNHGGGAPVLGWRLRSQPDDVIETDGLY